MPVQFDCNKYRIALGITGSKFTQKPRVIVSECAYAHEVWHMLCYTWKRCEVSPLREREPSQEMDLCSMMCASLNVKVHGVLMMLLPVNPREEVWYIITGIFFSTVLPPSFMIVVHRSHSAHQCTTICECDTSFIAFLYKARQSNAHTHTHVYIYIHSNASSVSDCHCQVYLPCYAGQLQHNRQSIKYWQATHFNNIWYSWLSNICTCCHHIRFITS